MTGWVIAVLYVVAGFVTAAAVDLAVMRNEGRPTPGGLLVMLMLVWPVVLSLALLTAFDD